MSKTVELTLLTKPGCHLCDDARAIVEGVCEDLRGRGVAIVLDERNILDDPELARLHSEVIPVVYINGRRHSIWKVDAERLTAALEKAAKSRLFSRA